MIHFYLIACGIAVTFSILGGLFERTSEPFIVGGWKTIVGSAAILGVLYLFR